MLGGIAEVPRGNPYPYKYELPIHTAGTHSHSEISANTHPIAPLQVNPREDWTPAHLHNVFSRSKGEEERNSGVIVFNKAVINGATISSTKYMTGRTRSNQFILQDYEDQGVYVGEVQYFLKIPHVDTVPEGGTEIEPLRLPIVKFYAKPKELSNNLWLVSDTTRVLERSAHDAIEPLSIVGKVVVAYPEGKEGGKMYCMTYKNLTSR